MTVSRIRHAVADSVIYGNLLITATDSSVSVQLESDDSTVVVIERTGPRTRKNIPIGTRDPRFLTARVNDREITVTPGSGRFLKRSYRILVEIEDRVISLGAMDIDTSTFIDGKPNEIVNQYGDLTARSDGSVEVGWAVPQRVRLVNRMVVPPEPTVDDVLIGFALAAAFGTGGLSVTTIVMGLVASVFPS
ncbi:hypothetical protein [Nocardia sp. CNY236]|uniref:hypothetical protein n=1 Tax=Nocardia sp. CNY236 TaxID=1169152 RepID=UPI000420F636|nr:hypothetical protein [Nocardia sp. CNY236]